MTIPQQTFNSYDSQKKPFIFFRYCKKCGKRFKPKGKFQEFCEPCRAKIRHSPHKNYKSGQYLKKLSTLALKMRNKIYSDIN